MKPNRRKQRRAEARARRDAYAAEQEEAKQARWAKASSGGLSLSRCAPADLHAAMAMLSAFGTGMGR